MARTETVTVVFTDLVGSTELASRLGHDAYEALRHEHFTALRTAVAAHNGTEVKTRPRRRARARVRRAQGRAGRLAPELARRVAELPAPQVAETERYLLFEAVTGLLSAASQQQPVVLILRESL